MRELEAALVAIKAYLAGDSATVDGVESRLSWLDGEVGLPKLPVSVAASGPHVIEVAARHADGVNLTVGAEPDRLRWPIKHARSRNPELSLGAFLNVAVDPDPAVARELVRGSTAIFARFSAEGAPGDGLSEVTREGIDAIAAGYDESKHGQASAVQARVISEEFVERFAIAGTPDQVTERLREVATLGIERLIIVPCSLDTSPQDLARSDQLFAAEVLPHLRNGE